MTVSATLFHHLSVLSIGLLGLASCAGPGHVELDKPLPFRVALAAEHVGEGVVPLVAGVLID